MEKNEPRSRHRSNSSQKQQEESSIYELKDLEELQDDDYFGTFKHDHHRHDSGPASQLLPDLPNFFLLFLLYFLQGIPVGLISGSLPILLQQSHKVSYTELGLLSFATYPFSFKLLWSPLVDSIFCRSFGQRRTWIIPFQFISGLIIYFSADYIENSINTEPCLITMTIILTTLMFMIATEDIAVDGWALTLLSEKNAKLGPTVQTIGQTCGYFLAYTLFLAFNSADFCNAYLRSEPLPDGLLSLSLFMKFWGIFFVLFGLLLLFKSENTVRVELTVKEAYTTLWKIAKAPQIRFLIFFLFSRKLFFSVFENMTHFKLLEKGLKKETMGLLALIAFPCEVIFSLITGKMTTTRILVPFEIGFMIRLVVCVLELLLVYFSDGLDSILGFGSVIALVIISSFATNLMRGSSGALFVRLSSKTSIGGSVMTLLNTLSNLGYSWPIFFIMSLVDFSTTKPCVGASGSDASVGVSGSDASVDGYYVVGVSSVVLGICWFFFLRCRIRQLEKLAPL